MRCAGNHGRSSGLLGRGIQHGIHLPPHGLRQAGLQPRRGGGEGGQLIERYVMKFLQNDGDFYGKNGRKNVCFVAEYVLFTFHCVGRGDAETLRRLGRRRVRLCVVWDDAE